MVHVHHITSCCLGGVRFSPAEVVWKTSMEESVRNNRNEFLSQVFLPKIFAGRKEDFFATRYKPEYVKNRNSVTLEVIINFNWFVTIFRSFVMDFLKLGISDFHQISSNRTNFCVVSNGTFLSSIEKGFFAVAGATALVLVGFPFDFRPFSKRDRCNSAQRVESSVPIM
jgi:hypothetical protein